MAFAGSGVATSAARSDHNHDAAYVNEGQADSVTSAMVANGTLLFADIGQNGCGLNQVMKWNGTAWACAADETGGGGGSAWSLFGNAGTNPATNFLGTTDVPTLTLRVSNTVGLRVTTSGSTPSVIGGHAANNVAAEVSGGVIGGGGMELFPNRVSDSYAVVGGGVDNTAGALGATVAGGGSNQATAGAATVGGGSRNLATALYATVGGGFENKANGARATVGGGDNNVAQGQFATIAGGHFNSAQATNSAVGGGDGNIASGDTATIGGGAGNQAAGHYATVGGGIGNTAVVTASTVSGGLNNAASGIEATVSGGGENTASGWRATVAGGADHTASGAYATVSGGFYSEATQTAATVGGGSMNSAGGAYATVGGGANNLAGGQYATIPGGQYNSAGGNYSLAAGRRAISGHTGAFVWADATDATFASTADNQFAVRATGGVSLTTAGKGVTVDGSKVWTAGNDGAGSGLDADLLDGQHASSLAQITHTHGASDITSGLLDNARFSAVADLLSEGMLDNNADDDLMFRSQSDGRYVNEGQVNSVTSAMIVDAGITFTDIGQNGCAAGEVMKWSGTAWACAPDIVGGAGASWSLTGNAGTTPGTNFLGTTDNQALEVKVNGQRSLRVEPGSSPNLIGGYSGNVVTGGAVGGAIGGGGANGEVNRVTDDYGTVGGGRKNEAGDNTGATNSASYATVGGGHNNQASRAMATVAGGESNSASSPGATVGGGESNSASGLYATVAGGGGWEGLTPRPNAATGVATTVGGGQGNVAGRSYATVAGGLVNIAGAPYATVSGGDHNSASNDWAVVAGGASNTASGQYAVVSGGNDNTAAGNFAGVVAGSSNDANGNKSVVGGGHGNQTTAEFGVIGGGAFNTAGDRAVVAGGTQNNAQGKWATISGGYSNTITSTAGTIPGGLEAAATHYGELAYASGSFSKVGDAQASLYVLRNETTSAVTTTLFLDGITGTQRISIPSGRTVSFDVLVVSRSSGGQSAGYRIQGVIENEGGTTRLVGTASTTVLGEDDPEWNAAAEADGALAVKVKGKAGVTVRWVASVRTTEVSW